LQQSFLLLCLAFVFYGLGAISSLLLVKFGRIIIVLQTVFSISASVAGLFAALLKLFGESGSQVSVLFSPLIADGMLRIRFDSLSAFLYLPFLF